MQGSRQLPGGASAAFEGRPFEDGALDPPHELVVDFDRRSPFPWQAYTSFLRPEAMAELGSAFPDAGGFAHHRELARGGQRPHDRYYLGCDPAAGEEGAPEPGRITSSELPARWRHLLRVLRGERYSNFLERMLGTRPGKVRFAWHMGYAGTEVSPHTDAENKLGTQIFFFNSARDWDPAYGGSTLILADPVKSRHPDFGDFRHAISVCNVANQSLLFRKTACSWHGVEPLRSPAGVFRRTFHVIAERGGSPC